MFLAMTGAVMEAYVDQMHRMRALWVLDAAQAALFGQLVKTKGGGKTWWQDWSRRAEGTARAAATGSRSNTREVIAWLRGKLGSAFSE